MGVRGGGFDRARHAVTSFEQRPVERFAVEGDEDGALGHAFG